jgi:hypothetical protein
MVCAALVKTRDRQHRDARMAMTGRIRPVDDGDLPQVASLYERTLRSGGAASPGLVDYFRQTLIGCPWADDTIPSLVYESGDGAVLGFIGSHVRRLTFDGRQVVMACSGQLHCDPVAQRQGVGALLLRRYMRGPQDLTITDGATDEVRALWERLGGSTLFPQSFEWTVLLYPWSTAAELLSQSQRRSLGTAAKRVAPALDAVTSAFAPRRRGQVPTTHAEPLTSGALVTYLPQVTRGCRLHPEYDEAYLDWLFGAMVQSRSRGRLVRRRITGSDREFLGWYVAYVCPKGISQVMQLAAVDTSALRRVVAHMTHELRRDGSIAVQGRMEPTLVDVLDRRSVLVDVGAWALADSQDPALVLAMTSSSSLLTRMDGEWWMGHHTEDFGARDPAGAALVR